MTSEASISVTSSPGLEAGRWPSNSPESLIQRQSGRDRRRASLSLMLGISSDSQTPATSPPRCSISLQSDARQYYLANRLRQLLENSGSILYSLTWKQKVTPAGRQYCQHVASARRTAVTELCLARSWTTASASDGTRGGTGITENMTGSSLVQQAQMSSWATCTTRDYKSGGTNLEDSLFRKSGKMRNDLVDYQAYLAAYPTPLTVPNSEKSHGQLSGSFRKAMALCAPAVENAVRITASGQVLTGSDAGMDTSGPLNPAHSRWLMGYPPVWCDCAVTAMQSSRKSPRRSSKRGTRASTTSSALGEEL